ncbi:Para-hydroxybenzoate--polyprenyltransferase, mitochondrial precursor (PHB:polyprenyltransferase) [Phytophthora pseudosyringae]|uniref:4-hydroxybenzoate polyprenyltransferase, mitochondrial n=1 Tax=Phytophthora pseudosyringae TaxID=221518 RepID=A0A8T1VU37_9STRA|nr:Para-hydroxybenzoate--polyprenyltransferase, mitochondrial precursor (PHB:polyprenyltransferase) [Phytophthora pseudosyringae]
MAARLLLARAAGRPRATPTGLQLALAPATRSGLARLATAPSVAGNRRVSFASTHLPGIQTSRFSSSPSPPPPAAKQDNAQDKSGVFQPKGDAFSNEKDTWAERHAPEWMVPYIQISRINRPAGTFMLLWPCFWSISMAAPVGQLPDLKLLALFGTGAFIMRSAGCTINDMWDKDFDKQVERTNKRPLAAGKLTYPQAWGFLAGQLSAGLAVLLQLNWYSVAMGASSLALVAAYPTMKRFTYWPQAFLGLTFNYGALLGWAAVHGSCEWPVVLPLYAGGVAWTLVYDTLYAHQDKKDDIQIGVRSTALLFGDNTKPVLNCFSAAAIAGFGTAGYMAGLDWPFFLGLTGGAAHLAWQVNTAKLDDPINLQARFASNKWFGALMFASVVAGNAV